MDRNRKATDAYYADYSNFSDNSLKITIQSKSSQSSTFASANDSNSFRFPESSFASENETGKGSEVTANWRNMLPKAGQKGCQNQLRHKLYRQHFL